MYISQHFVFELFEMELTENLMENLKIDLYWSKSL